MINLMLVAGERTSKLANFFKERGAFSVDFEYDSLAANEKNIKSSIVKVDKLLYVYQAGVIEIRDDMRVLSKLLSDNDFFSPGEIVFVVTDSPDAENAKRYFGSVMEDCKFQNYRVQNTGERPTFTEIYDSVLGVSHSENFKNSYRDVYRVERNKEASITFDPQDDRDLAVEPFNLDRIKDYKIAKENAKKTESGQLQRDNMLGIRKFDAPSLGEIKFKSVLEGTRTFLITGLEKSGISVWTCALAVSTVVAGCPVTVIDFTDSGDIESTLSSRDIPTESVSMLEMSRVYTPASDVVNVCTIQNDREDQVKLEFLQHIYSGSRIGNGIIFIAAQMKDVPGIYALLHNELEQLFVCLSPEYKDVYKMQSFLGMYSEEIQIKVLLNRRLNLMEGFTYLEGTDVRKLLPFKHVGIVNPITFSGFDLDNEIYMALVGVKP